jgi:hypothetical protein
VESSSLNVTRSDILVGLSALFIRFCPLREGTREPRLWQAKHLASNELARIDRFALRLHASCSASGWLEMRSTSVQMIPEAPR